MRGVSVFLASNKVPDCIFESHFDTLPVIQCWPYVQVEGNIIRRSSSSPTSIKIDDIAYPRSTTLNDPVMPVERRRIPARSEPNMLEEKKVRPTLVES